jgi:uncharacterized protein (TIGR03435 family)
MRQMTRDDAAGTFPRLCTFIVALTCATALALTTSGLKAQSSTSASGGLRFEVASVKPNTKTFNEHFLGAAGAFSGVRILPGGTLQASWVDLRGLIRRAYDLKPFQLEGGPGWLDTDKFDIMARAGRDATPAELNLMLRTLLAERFGLRVRQESREADVYALTRARSDGRLGPNITPTSPECAERLDRGETTSTPPPPPTQTEPPPVCGRNWRGGSANGGTRWSLGGAKMDYLVVLLGPEFDGPLEDRTNLTGRYDIVLEYHSTFMERREGIRPDSPAPTAPALRNALRDQLGLRVDTARGPLPVTIIEAVQRPTPD